MAALGDPTRAAIVVRLGDGTTTVSDLSAPFSMSLRGVLNHIQVLESAGVVRTDKIGRQRRCQLQPAALDDLSAWLTDLRARWERRIDRIEAYLQEEQ